MRGVLTPAIELWSFESLGGLPSPNFGSVSLILPFPSSGVATSSETNIEVEIVYLANPTQKLAIETNLTQEPKAKVNYA
jgi:hypothetical protein